MIDFDKIPKQTYDELVNLIGKKKAEEYIKKEKYNYKSITYMILYLKLMHSLGFAKGKIIMWPYLTIMLQVFIIITIVSFVLVMLNVFDFI